MDIWSLIGQGGEIIVPEIPSYRVVDMIKAFESEFPTEEIEQAREKYEEMISAADSYTTLKYKITLICRKIILA